MKGLLVLIIALSFVALVNMACTTRGWFTIKIRKKF